MVKSYPLERSETQVIARLVDGAIVRIEGAGVARVAQQARLSRKIWVSIEIVDGRCFDVSERSDTA